MAGKRGGRLGWTDDQGNRVYWKFIGHSTEGICWRELEPGELQKPVDTEAPKSSAVGQKTSFRSEEDGKVACTTSSSRTPQNIDDLVALFPAYLADPLERSFFTTRQCRDLFARRGWSRDSAEAMRDTAIAQGLLASFRGPRSAVFYGRASVVAEYLRAREDSRSNRCL
jgi:hypothetical protein